MKPTLQSDAVELYRAFDQSGSPARVILLCDHATNRVPDWIGPLGIAPEDMARHIAWDVGARGVTLALADALGASAVLSRFSRLVIDPNRGADDPTLVMKLYDGTLIPGNRTIDAAGIAERLERLHAPYHSAIRAVIDDTLAAGVTPVLISIHSFTPQLRGQSRRPWHLGVLWDQDARLVRPLLDRLSSEDDLVIGDNEPYSGALRGDSMWWHGTQRGLAHTLIELRNDLISTPEMQAAWGARLAPIIAAAIRDMDAAVGDTCR